jgi:O-antigen/teichoic acid export membrane protein
VGFLFALSLFAESATAFLGGSARGYTWAVMLLIVLESMQGFLLNHLRASRRPRSFSASSVIRLVAITAATIWLMAVEKSGLSGLFWGRAIGDAFGVAVLLFFCRSSLSWRVSRKLAASMLRYGFPLVFGALIMMLLDGSGRYFLNHFSNLHEVGIFSIGSKIASLMRLLLVMPFGVAWGGMMFQIAGKPNARVLYSKLVGYLFVLSVALALVLSLLTPALFAIFATPAYFEAIPVVPLLLLVQAVTVLQYPMAIGIYLCHETKKLVPIFLGGLLSNIVLSWLLVPKYGTSGAAVAWLGGWVVILLLLGVVGQRKYPLQYEWRPLVLGGGLAAITVLVPLLNFVHFSWWWLAAQLGGSLTIILLVGMFLINDIRSMHQRYREA